MPSARPETAPVATRRKRRGRPTTEESERDHPEIRGERIGERHRRVGDEAGRDGDEEEDGCGDVDDEQGPARHVHEVSHARGRERWREPGGEPDPVEKEGEAERPLPGEAQHVTGRAAAHHLREVRDRVAAEPVGEADGGVIGEPAERTDEAAGPPDGR
jgi:hypothetical protein